MTMAVISQYAEVQQLSAIFHGVAVVNLDTDKQTASSYFLHVR